MTCIACFKEFDLIEGDKAHRHGVCTPECGLQCQQDHPVLPKVGVEAIEWPGLVVERERFIQMEKVDPLRVQDESYLKICMPHWAMADEDFKKCSEMLVSGGNRAAKTMWAARKVVQKMLDKPGMSVICCHTSVSSSVTVQQPAVYHWLPAEMKQTKKTKTTYINYSMKNGFTDGSFILPNHSRCVFLNYTQSDQQIEGREADLVWCDELVPMTWIEALRFRLVSRRGQLIVTQTPIEGVSSVYREFIAGSKIVEFGDASLLAGRTGAPGWPAGKVPRRMEKRQGGKKVIFFYTRDNVFSPYDELEKKLEGAPVTQVLTRAYGWATDQTGKAFSRFKQEVHCIPKSKIPEGGTLYMVADPAGARNWFCLWVKLYEDGKMVVVREFPDQPTHGEWALPAEKPDGKPGPAQTQDACKGIAEYRRLFRAIEGEIGDTPMARLIDPKAGGTPALSAEGGTTLIDLLALSEDEKEDEPMSFIPAAGVPVPQREAAINDALAYDVTKEITVFNEPKLYIVEDCYNLVHCLEQHTGKDGQKGATKDPIDCLGMALTSPIEWVGPGGMGTVGGGAY